MTHKKAFLCVVVGVMPWVAFLLQRVPLEHAPLTHKYHEQKTEVKGPFERECIHEVFEKVKKHVANKQQRGLKYRVHLKVDRWTRMYIMNCINIKFTTHGTQQ